MSSIREETFTTLASRYPKFKEDLARELAMHRASLRIIKLRIESNLSKAEYAKKVGIERTNLSRLEKGKINPKLSTLIELAHQNGYEVDIQLKPFGYSSNGVGYSDSCWSSLFISTKRRYNRRDKLWRNRNEEKRILYSDD